MKRAGGDISTGTREEKKQKDAEVALNKYLAAKGPLNLPTKFGGAIEEKDFKDLMDSVDRRIGGFFMRYRDGVWKESGESIVQEDYEDPMNGANPDERGLSDQFMHAINYSPQKANVNVAKADSTTGQEKHWGFDEMLCFTAKQGTTVKRVIVLLQAKVVLTEVLKNKQPMKSIDFGYKAGKQLRDLGHAINCLRSKADANTTIVIGGYLGFHQEYLVYIPQETVYADYERKKKEGGFNWTAFCRIQATEYLKTPAQFALFNIFARALSPDAVIEATEVEPDFETMAQTIFEEVDITPPGNFPNSVISKLDFKIFDHPDFKDEFKSAGKKISTFVKEMLACGVNPDERGLTDQLVVELTDEEAYRHTDSGFTFSTCGQKFENKWGYDILWSYTPDHKTNVLLIFQAKKQIGDDKVVNYVYNEGMQLQRLQESEAKIKKAVLAQLDSNRPLVVITAYLIYGPDDFLVIPLEVLLEQKKTKKTDVALSEYFNANRGDYTPAKFVKLVDSISKDAK